MSWPLSQREDMPSLPNEFLWLRGLPVATARSPLWISVAVHSLVLFVLLQAPKPDFVKPSSIVAGTNGTAVTQIYWPAERDDQSKDSSLERNTSAEEARTNQERRFQLPQPLRLRDNDNNKVSVQMATANETPTALDQSSSHQSPPAGSPFGSLSYGSVFGNEIRPAYPISGSDPVADPGELPPRFEGDVIVEVTIDEQGNIVAKSVIQSINPALDAKSLLALASWRFRPATRNGVPIASKHDVYFHFRSR